VKDRGKDERGETMAFEKEDGGWGGDNLAIPDREMAGRWNDALTLKGTQSGRQKKSYSTARGWQTVRGVITPYQQGLKIAKERQGNAILLQGKRIRKEKGAVE